MPQKCNIHAAPVCLFIQNIQNLVFIVILDQHSRQADTFRIDTAVKTSHLNFEVRHPRCVSTKSNYKVYAYIVKHNYI
jgi:hypothetical protein